MTKHRRFLDKQKDDFTENVEKIELEEENSTPKNGMDLKSILLSGSKYVYIIAAAALLSGIFTPLTLGVEIERVLSGMFSLFLGLGGGIAIFLGTKNQKFTTIMICGGLGMMVVSLILILEVADRSLFG
jgi:hypothetical protein|tara:strand:+ start:938 stop:1324 length:387 start_codon:yes stop_codon:yes gene_type:complete